MLPTFAFAHNTAATVIDSDNTRRPVLETIIVTAQRRSENLQDVAIAVSAISADALNNAGISKVLQLQTLVPSLTYNATSAAAQPYIRGIGTRLATVGLEPSIATYIDGRYVSRPVSALLDLMDIEQVEVLKGPQGTLYGRNAAGGAIRAITVNPGNEHALKLMGKAGSFSYKAFGLLAGGPLSDDLKGQIAASVEHRNGFASNLVPTGRNTADDISRQALRGKLLWELSAAISAQLNVSWWQRDDWIGHDLTAAGLPEANRGAALYGGTTSRDRDYFASALNPDNDLRELASELRFDVDFDDMSFTSITTFADADFKQAFDVDASSVVLLDLDTAEHSKTWSQELQLLSTTDSPFKWIGGIYYLHQQADNLYLYSNTISAQPQFPPGTDITNGFQQVSTTAYALYGQISYHFNHRWSLTLGSRWNHEDKKVSLRDHPGAVTNAPTPFASQDSWHELTPRASLEYRRGFGLIYLSYTHGFKSGGYNYPASLNPVLHPEIVDNYELGFKALLLQDRLRLSSALFVYRFGDLQVTRGGQGVFLSTENAADAQARGLEMDATFAVFSNLTVSGGLIVMDSEYRNYTAGVFVPRLTPPFGSAPLPGGLDVQGRSLLRAPDEAAYLMLSYEPVLSNGARLPLNLTWSYKGSYYFDFSAVPATEWLKQDAYATLNARLAYASANGKWEVALWGSNLTDESFYEDAVLNSVSSRVSHADPRMIGVQLVFKR